jgi:hypothetical protein
VETTTFVRTRLAGVLYINLKMQLNSARSANDHVKFLEVVLRSLCTEPVVDQCVLQQIRTCVR